MAASSDPASQTFINPGETVVPDQTGELPVQSASAAPAPAETSKPAKITRLGDFEVKRKLGQGGMGTVYLAHQVSLDRPVALKVLSRDVAKRAGFVERFLREARSMAKINHPNVVGCYHVGEEKGLHYVAIELIDGQSMQAWLNQLGKIPVPDAVLVTIICAEALGHAHSLNMVHRDVKPDNILVTKSGIVKVSDLGLAKAVDDTEMSMTQSGAGLGTPHYMPPEQARNAKHVDQTSDIYALGTTLYHFVTGQVPFAGDSIVDLITNKEKSHYKPARQINKEVPDRLSMMIDKAMAKDRKGRYATCAEFVKDLETLQIASTSLSFVSGAQVIRKQSYETHASDLHRTSAPPVPSLSKTPSSQATHRTSAEDVHRDHGAVSNGTWFVRHADSEGHTKVSSMSTAQVLQAMKTDRLDMKTQAAISSKAPFLPLAQIPVFQEEAKRLVTRQTVKSKERSLAAEYAKIDKQVQRQKWWRLLARFRDGTLGIVGLILWLALVGAAIVGAVMAYPWVANYVANQLKVK